MGAGSIGGYFGGMLCRGGNQVTLIARGRHRQAIADHGLKVVTDDEDLIIRCDTTDDPRQVGPVDLVLLTVKTYHNPRAVPTMLPMIGPDTIILCLQNGIDSYQAAVAAAGENWVLPGAAYIEASLPEPGVVKQTGKVVRIIFSEVDGSDSPRGRRIRRVLEQSGIPAEFTQDIRQTLWSKFLFIATLAGVTAMSRETLAQLMPRPEWREVIIGCMREIQAVGRASGVNLAQDIVESTLIIYRRLHGANAGLHARRHYGRPAAGVGGPQRSSGSGGGGSRCTNPYQRFDLRHGQALSGRRLRSVVDLQSPD